MPSINESRPIPAPALRAADAFYAHAQPFLKSIGRDYAANEKAIADLGGLIASATTLALALELYFKAIRILVRMDVPEHHDLWALYKGLPEQVRKSIEDRYDVLEGPDGDDIHSLEIQLAVGEFSDEAQKEEDEVDTSAKSIKAVLKRSKNAFTTWRYLYEGPKSHKTFATCYEFHFLGNAAIAARAGALQLLDQR